MKHLIKNPIDDSNEFLNFLFDMEALHGYDDEKLDKLNSYIMMIADDIDAYDDEDILEQYRDECGIDWELSDEELEYIDKTLDEM